jgi:hypothetical protein
VWYKYVYDELTECYYLVEDDGQLFYLIKSQLDKLSDEELVNLLGQDVLTELRKRR